MSQKSILALAFLAAMVMSATVAAACPFNAASDGPPPGPIASSDQPGAQPSGTN